MIHQPLSPYGVDWLTPLYTSTCMIHGIYNGGQFTYGVHPQISPSLRLLVLCLVRSDLFVKYYCLYIFFPKTHFFL